MRTDAYYCLKHFPGDYDMELSQEALPEVWGELIIAKYGENIGKTDQKGNKIKGKTGKKIGKNTKKGNK